MEEVVSMSINDPSYKTANDATAVLYNFIRSRNDPFDEPEHIPAAVVEVPDMHAGEQRLGNAVRQALIMQLFT